MREENSLRQAIDARLSGLHVTEQMRMDILRQARGEAYPRGRSKLSLSLVFALTALLLAATAYAAVRFGVLAFHEEQAENETYLQHIQEIDEHVAGEYASVTVNDAVFDGSSLSLALDIRCADGTTPVFLYPRLRAQSEGQALGTQVHGFQIAAENHSMAASSIGMDACDGIWMPLEGGEGDSEGHFNFDAALLGREGSALPYGVADAPVTWTLSLEVLRPLFPVETCSMEQYGVMTEDGSWEATLEDYAAIAAESLREQKILLPEDGSLFYFASLLPVPGGMTQEEWDAAPLDERLLASGMFERVEEMRVSFTTQMPDVAVLSAPQTFDLGDSFCTVDSLFATFARADVAFHVRSKEGQPCAAESFSSGAGHWEFIVQAPQGQAELSGSSLEASPEEGTVRYFATYTLTRPVSSLTFIPVYVEGDAYFDADAYTPTEEDRSRAFTVEIR